MRPGRKVSSPGKVGTLQSISRSIFSKSTPKKDSPLKNGVSRTSRVSPTSITTKTLFTDIDLTFETLSPDSLFKLLKDLKWKMAVSRIAQFQEEPCRWVIQHDDGKNKILFRRLPIHEACIRFPSAELIAALLDAYPEGASAKDNQGRTPLHCAVIHGAHIDVVHLLLNVCYDSILEQDFFFKVPKDYAHTTTFTHKNEVIAALTTKSKKEVSLAALGVRSCLKALHPIHGDRSGQDQAAMESKRTAFDDHAEQLSQAMVEADTANAISSVAIANEVFAKEKMQQLKERIIGIEKQLEEETANRERNENCVFLLEMKQETSTSALAAKNREIKKLIDQTMKDKQKIQADAAMKGKLKKRIGAAHFGGHLEQEGQIFLFLR